MDKILDKFVYYMIEKLGYEGIRIAEIENVEEAQVLFKKGEGYNHYIVLLDKENMKDYLTYREVINHNAEKISEIIFLVVDENPDSTMNIFMKNLIQMDISSVVFMDKSTGNCVNLHKCTDTIFRDIQRQSTEAHKSAKGGLDGIVYGIKKHKVTFALTALNIAVFILIVIDGKSFENFFLSSDLYVKGALPSKDLFTGEWYRIITSGFLHADIMHLVSNMIGIVFVGSIIEDLYGKSRYTAIYFTAIVLGSIGSLLMLPENTWSIGASGGVFGLIGAQLAYGFIMRKRVGKAYLNMLIRGTLIMIIIGMTTPNVNNIAHIGGLIGGLIAGLLFKPKVKIK